MTVTEPDLLEPRRLPGGRPRRRQRQPLQTRTGVMLFAAEIAVLLALWQWLVGELRLVNPLFLPPPSKTLEGFGELLSSPKLGDALISSLQAWSLGYGIAVVVGVALGLLIGSSVIADRLLGPIVWPLYATPWLAYAPLSKAWFGFGLTPVVFIVFIAGVFPTLLNTSAGIRTVSRSLVDAGRIFGAGRAQIYRKVLLPATVPFILAGMRQSAVLATVAMVVAEMTTSGSGVGGLIAFTANTYATDQSFAAIVMVVAWSVAMTQLIGLLARVFAPWTTGARR
jgi:ABC-type nitrate/sulfonate/bicarbonate transport system permease component